MKKISKQEDDISRLNAKNRKLMNEIDNIKKRKITYGI